MRIPTLQRNLECNEVIYNMFITYTNRNSFIVDIAEDFTRCMVYRIIKSHLDGKMEFHIWVLKAKKHYTHYKALL